MSVADQVLAIRRSAALSPGDHIACARVSGADAHEAVDRVSPRELYVRSGQMLHTLFLDPDARPVADVYLCADEDDYLVLAEGLDGPALADVLAAGARGLDAEVTDLGATHGILCLNGPYAWEVLAEVSSPDVIGLPYLGFFHEERFTCFRAGSAGEYGYLLLAERGRLDELRAAVLDVGARFDLAEAGLEALELAALEAFFWNPRRESPSGVTPIELQLQWRVSYGRSFTGAEALAARRGAARSRAVLVAAEGPLAGGTEVTALGRPVGTLLHAGASPTRGDWLALALIDRAIAHPGVEVDAGGACARVISAPAVNNRSLFVDPQRHSYASREADAFPPLVRPS